MCTCIRLSLSVWHRYACVDCVDCVQRSRIAMGWFFNSSLAATKNQYTAAAKQQQYNASRVSSSYLCASSHGVRALGWCTSGYRTTTTLSRPMQRPNMHRWTSYQLYEAHSSSKNKLIPCLSLECVCSPFSAQDDPPDTIRTGNLVYQVHNLTTITYY